MVTSYFDPATKLIYAIGAVVGLIGGMKVYSKFSSGDPDTSKTAASWFGACIFLMVCEEPEKLLETIISRSFTASCPITSEKFIFSCFLFYLQFSCRRPVSTNRFITSCTLLTADTV